MILIELCVANNSTRNNLQNFHTFSKENFKLVTIYMANQSRTAMAVVSLVRRPIPSFSMLHAEKQEGLVSVVT